MFVLWAVVGLGDGRRTTYLQ